MLSIEVTGRETNSHRPPFTNRANLPPPSFPHWRMRVWGSVYKKWIQELSFGSRMHSPPPLLWLHTFAEWVNPGIFGKRRVLLKRVNFPVYEQRRLDSACVHLREIALGNKSLCFACLTERERETFTPRFLHNHIIVSLHTEIRILLQCSKMSFISCAGMRQERKRFGKASKCAAIGKVQEGGRLPAFSSGGRVIPKPISIKCHTSVQWVEKWTRRDITHTAPRTPFPTLKVLIRCRIIQKKILLCPMRRWHPKSLKTPNSWKFHTWISNCSHK